ncbi:MAG TPA: hypothetical protein DIT05_13600 [Morganella sp. (in: Bacteria)]|nr:hypothetical protein [Morganella sp. (in: enterobacteria)]
MEAIHGPKTAVITMNDIQQPEIKPVKTTESGVKTSVEMGHSPVKNDAAQGDVTIAPPKTSADGKESGILDKASSSLADLQSLLSSIKDAKDQISGKLSELKNAASADNLKASASELNLSSNWQIAFSVISGALSLGTMVLSSVTAYQDHVAAQQESTLKSGIDKTQDEITKTTDALKNPDLTAESKIELESQLSELEASLVSQQSALSELQAGTETRKAWTDLALNLMQGASGFINDNLITQNKKETETTDNVAKNKGDSLTKLDDIIKKSEAVLDKVKDNAVQAKDFLQVPARA